MTKCITYCRVSSKGQLEGGGLTSQARSCRDEADRAKITLIRNFDDEGFSGSKDTDDRPGLKAALEFIKDYNSKNEEKITILLTDSVDRIARDVSVHHSIKVQLQILGVKIKLVNANYEETPIGRFCETIAAANAQLMREENAARVVSRQQSRMLDGYWTFACPVGYKFEKSKGGGKVMILDEPNASIVKEGLEGYANGIFTSINDIRKFFERKGLTLRETGKRKPGEKVSVSKATISNMLRNILYTGYLSYGKTSTNKKTGLVKAQWEIPLTIGKHPGIISTDTFTIIQEKLTKSKPYDKERKTINEDYPLRQFLFCDCCNLPLSSGTSAGRNKHYSLYTYNKKCICKDKASEVKIPKSISADILHTNFDEFIQGLGLQSEFVTFLQKVVFEEHNNRQKDKHISYENIAQEINKLDEQIMKTVDTLTTSDSLIVRSKLEQKIEALESQKNNLELKITIGKSKDALTPDLIDKALHLMQNPYKIWQTRNIHYMHMLLKLVFRKGILLNRKSGTFGTSEISALFLISKQFSSHQFNMVDDTGLEPVTPCL